MDYRRVHAEDSSPPATPIIPPARLRLLFVSNLFPDTLEPYRGLDNACLLHQLSRECEVRVVSPRPALPGLRKRVARNCRVVDQPFLPIYPPTPYIPRLRRPLNHHLFASAIRSTLLDLRRQFPYDVILVSWTFPDMAAIAKLQAELRVPFVGIVQGSDAHAYLQMPGLRATVVNAVNSSFATVTRSAKLAELLARAGAHSGLLHPIYNGVDLDLFRPADRVISRRDLGLPENTHILLFVGGLVRIKNPLLLIRAHAALCSRNRSRRCLLVLIGGGPLEEKARRTAKEGGYGELVLFAGRKEAAAVARYMQASDLLCLSSDNEGVPNVILEALGCGLRVVATAVGGIPEVVSHDTLGRLVTPGSLEELADAIDELLGSAAAPDSIRQHATNFTWDKAASSYLRLLRAAVHNGTGA